MLPLCYYNSSMVSDDKHQLTPELTIGRARAGGREYEEVWAYTKFDKKDWFGSSLQW